MSYWGRYVPVAERLAKAQRKMKQLRKKGKVIQPVEITGRTIARSFWGKSWCEHLNSFSDYANRLPRGQRYVRNGSVCHLEFSAGHIDAYVCGSSLYTVAIEIEPLESPKWQAIQKRCAGQIGSMLELLQGRLSEQVMRVVTDRENGLFPAPGEIRLGCSCPDWAVMCKHVAAVLYGIGSRLDEHPDLLFLLRAVDAEELIAVDLALPEDRKAASGDALDEDQLGDIFGIDLDEDEEGTTETSKASGRSKTTGGKQAKPARNKPKIRPTGRSVARLRNKLGVSVADFAEETGVTPTTVYRWEATKGRLNLQRRTLQALDAIHRRVKEASRP